MQNTKEKKNSISDSILSLPLFRSSFSPTSTRHPKKNKQIIISALSVCMIRRYIENELVLKLTENEIARTTNHAYPIGGLVGNGNRIENRLSYFWYERIQVISNTNQTPLHFFFIFFRCRRLDTSTSSLTHRFRQCTHMFDVRHAHIMHATNE